MKQFRRPTRTTITMAIYIASTTTSLGVARGFHTAKPVFGGGSACKLTMLRSSLNNKPIQPKLSPLLFSSTATSQRFSSPSFLNFRGGASSSSLPSSSRQLSSSVAPDTEESIDNNSKEIEEAAQNCLTSPSSGLSITGSIPPPQNFGGISYLDTTSLAKNNAHRVIFILGGPGAGKGTQSERIVDTYKCVHLSVGELLRAGSEKEGYPHADLVKECLIQGKIVPVELSLGLLRIAMDEKAEEGSSSFGSRIFLVDGFPRNYDNVQGWMEHMPSYTSVLGALVYNCPMEVLEERIMSRAETSGRSDDNLTSARRRFDTFVRETEPVVRALEMVEGLQAQENEGGGSQLDIVNIDGTGTVEEVWDATESAMNSYVRNDILTANMNLLKAVEAGDFEAYAELCGDELVLAKGDEEDTQEARDQRIQVIFDMQEEPMKEDAASVSNAKIDIRDGVKALVSYDRGTVRESRGWQHGPKGWRCVAFSRKELE